MSKRLDAADEIARLNPEVANKAQVYWDQVENVCSDPATFHRRMVQTGASGCVSGLAVKKENGSDNTMLVAAVCAAGLAFYIYAG